MVSCLPVTDKPKSEPVMPGYLIYLLLMAAGMALVFQNLLLVRITQSVSTVIITLVFNAATGLSILLVSLLVRKGLGGFTEMLTALRPWVMLPGLLGCFFVFAAMTGYQVLGAPATIAILLASQLLTGLVVSARQEQVLPDKMSIFRAVLLIAGAVLILRGRR